MTEIKRRRSNTYGRPIESVRTKHGKTDGPELDVLEDCRSWFEAKERGDSFEWLFSCLGRLR